jgi:hypothetical protein
MRFRHFVKCEAAVPARHMADGWARFFYFTGQLANYKKIKERYILKELYFNSGTVQAG